MTVTSFGPTLSSGPASTGPASTGPASGKGSAGKSGKAEAAGKHSPDDADESATGPDGFLATLSTALAAVAAVAPATDTASATLTVTLPGGGPSTVPTTNPVAGAPLPGAPLPGAPLPGAPLPGVTPLTAASPTAAPPPGGEPSTVPTTSQVGQSPLPTDPRLGGEQPTVLTSQTVDTSPLQQQPGHPTLATAAAGGTSLDAVDDAGELLSSAAPAVDDAPLPVTAVDGSGATSVTVTGGAPIDMTAGGSSEKTTAVLRQVFPEVTRVAAQAGPGTHRLSITLHPEDLGEVKVTLLVRAGSVHVSMTAQSGAAHDALLQGAPELHRLLEVTGGDARVVVRDTSAAAAASTTDQRGSEGRGQQSAYAAQTGDSGDPRNPDRNSGRDPGRTTSGAPADEPTSPRGSRPGSSTGAGQTGTPVHPGRLDRLM